MNYNQNHKISQITPSTLVVGIDIAEDKHVARAQRTIEAMNSGKAGDNFKRLPIADDCSIGDYVHITQ